MVRAAGRLPILFLWHHHQPYYRMPDAELPRLPWVRLHSVRGYADMLAAVRASSARMTFNFTPILLEQLEFAAQHRPADEFERVSCLSPADMSEAERRFVLRHFFSIHWPHRIRNHGRYAELLARRGEHGTEDQLRSAMEEYATHDYLDLMALFNLNWIGFSGDNDGQIRELRSKQRGYDAQDIAAILSYHHRVLDLVIAGYREQMAGGQIEISTSPYAHPILPLLCDSDIAGIDIPRHRLPKPGFGYPEDAKRQLRRGAETYRRVWGADPRGLWPSEGSVSDAALELARSYGFAWAATDDGILSRSEVTRQAGRAAHTSYEWQGEHGTLRLYFRDHGLSDAIGFRYAPMPAAQAVGEFIGSLLNIERDTRHDPHRCVCVALDGENPWESFADGGREFMTTLFNQIQDHERLTTMLIGAHAEQAAGGQVRTVHPGSWIDSNFRIWIGDSQKNAAWSELLRVRRMLDELTLDERVGAECQDWLLRAEGSDWLWWFGEPFSSLYDADFDELFRAFLKQIYVLAGVKAPSSLDAAIKRPARVERRFQPVFEIEPTIDGKVTSFYEWVGACHIPAAQYGSVMGRSEGAIRDIYYGFDGRRVFIRIDPHPGVVRNLSGELIVRVVADREAELVVPFSEPACERREDGIEICAGEVYELALDYACVALERGGDCQIMIEVLDGGTVIERHPPAGGFRFVLPTIEAVASNWLI
ncbi:hypothetical protein HZB60_04845 [candidate division KSB1 bacterium]|nr:hypothetical protein [candidate division KSB1 bacterium]